MGPDLPSHRAAIRPFLLREWPYLAMLALSLFGVAYTSIAHKPLSTTGWR